MASTETSRSAKIRSRLNHPIIDTDGHTVELMPVYLDYVKQIGGADMVKRYQDATNSRGNNRWAAMSDDERRDARATCPPWWARPARNTLDRATASIPRLLHQRMDDLGMDYTVLYPTEGLVSPPRFEEEEVRRVSCRALNAFHADIYREYADRMGTVWPIAVTFSITSFVWLCILAFWRPSDLYRWSPTGKAWNTYRTKLLVTSEHEGLNSLGTVGRFQILNDPVDEPFAQRIQEELTERGGQKVDAAKESTRIVLVLSNRTQLAWLDALETNLRDKDLITVVVTAIGLSPTLAWLWKRQWIDFRRCTLADDSKRRSALPVPEALDRARIPLRPALAHHLLCSMAGLGLMGANVVADAQQSDLDTLGMLTGISTGLLLWLAWRFAGRRVSQTRFNTWLTVVWSALTLLCVAQFIRYFEVKGFSLRFIPAAIFLLMAPFVAVRWRSGLAFWFPVTSLRRPESKKLLTPSRSWWTLILFSLYGGGWMWLLGLIK